jgi:hypothetical protein
MHRRVYFLRDSLKKNAEALDTVIMNSPPAGAGWSRLRASGEDRFDARGVAHVDELEWPPACTAAGGEPLIIMPAPLHFNHSGAKPGFCPPSQKHIPVCTFAKATQATLLKALY